MSINEERSISSDVMNASVQLVNIIVEKMKQISPIQIETKRVQWEKDNGELEDGQVKHLFYVVDVHKEMQNSFSQLNCIKVDTWDFDSVSSFQQNVSINMYGGDCDFENGEITLKTPMIGGELIVDIAKIYMAHEIEHMYQKIKALQNGNPIKTSALYMQAMSVLESNADDILKTIAYILYFLDNKEIDAKAHESYSELISMFEHGVDEPYENLQAINSFRQISEEFEYLKHIDPQLLGNYLKIFGMTRNSFMRYVRGQMSAFLRKMRRIFSLCCDKMRDIHETYKMQMPKWLFTN